MEKEIRLFRTSTPKKRMLPRSSTPIKFYSLIKKNDCQSRIRYENCCQQCNIQLSSLLYRPKIECRRQGNIEQSWDI